MLFQVLTTTLLKFALLLVIGGFLLLGLELQVPFKSAPEASYRTAASVATLHCNSAGFCDLILRQ